MTMNMLIISNSGIWPIKLRVFYLNKYYTNTMNYNKLSEEALEASNSKGFKFTSIEQSLALIISEISEALEADRTNLRADKDSIAG